MKQNVEPLAHNRALGSRAPVLSGQELNNEPKVRGVAAQSTNEPGAKVKNPAENPMREIRLEKITLNMGAGESGPKLEKAKAIMEKIVGRNVVTTATHKRTTFGMAKKRPIGVMILLRGDEAMSWLKKFLQAADNKIKVTQFDTTGNFSLGVAEYISIPGIKYDPDVGIMGLDVAVTLGRPGFRVKRRRIKPQKIGKAHRITREESIEWAKRELGAEIVGEK